MATTVKLSDIKMVADAQRPTTRGASRAVRGHILIPAQPGMVHVALRVIASFDAVPLRGALTVKGGPVDFDVDASGVVAALDLGSYVCMENTALEVTLTEEEAPAPPPATLAAPSAFPAHPSPALASRAHTPLLPSHTPKHTQQDLMPAHEAEHKAEHKDAPKASKSTVQIHGELTLVDDPTPTPTGDVEASNGKLNLFYYTIPAVLL